MSRSSTSRDVPRDAEIVGIVGDVKQFSLDDEPSLDLYVPIAQVAEPSVQYLTNSITWVIRTSADPQAIEGAARREIHAVDGDIALSSVKTLDQGVSGSVAPRRFNLARHGLATAANLSR
jgi:putative ABC transport system permease protein